MHICNDSYKARFKCKICGTVIEGYLDDYPRPDIYAETANESRDCTGGNITCPNCGKENDFSISVDFNGYEICVPSDLEVIKE